MSFVFPFPINAVILQTAKTASAMLVRRRKDGVIGIALFTEELFAERSRDNWNKDADLFEIQDREQLIGLVRDFISGGGISHVAVDHQQGDDKAAWIDVSELGL